MANFEILDNIIHKGIILKKGMIVSDAHQEFNKVAAGLIDEGLARETASDATHSLAMVDQSAQAVALGQNGQLPNAAVDEAERAKAKAAQLPATPQQQAQTEQQANAESQIDNKGKLLNRIRGNAPPPPTGANPADVAAAADNVA